MRVLLVSPSFPPAREGEAEHAYQLAARLAAKGHQVHVWTNDRKGLYVGTEFEVGANSRGWGWTAIVPLLRRVRRLRPDGVLLVYTAWLFDHHPMITFLPFFLRRASPATRLLVVAETEQPAQIAGLPARIGRKVLERLAGVADTDYAFGTLLSQSDALAALGPTILNRLAERCPSLICRALVTPPPPLIEVSEPLTDDARGRARAAFGASEESVVLAFFGYVYPGKGVETLFAALKWLVEHGADARLLMLGGGRSADDASSRHTDYEGEMKTLASTLGMADRVVWQPGYKSGSTAVGLQLRAADVAVLPFDDGAELRRSTIAAVASAGLPLVTTTPRQPELAFVHGRNAMLVAPKNPPSLGAAVLQIIDDPVLRSTLRQGSLQLIETHYSWGRAVDAIENALIKPARGAQRA